MLTEQQLDHFRQLLLTQKQELEALQQTGKDASATVELDQTRVGRLSRMDAMQGQQMALEAERRRKQELVQIQAALARIEKGEFNNVSIENCTIPLHSLVAICGVSGAGKSSLIDGLIVDTIFDGESEEGDETRWESSSACLRSNSDIQK